MIGLKCPQCEHILPPNAKSCPNCGVDLAFVALLAERAFLYRPPIASHIRSTPQAVIPKIGEYLVKRGLISEQQLQVALDRQRELAAHGQQHLLGQTLVEMGFVEPEDLDRAVNQQIIDLHAALQESNRTLERRIAEKTAELRNALDRLKELNLLKANIISNVSHELRTPLAHIKGYIELMADGQLGPISSDQERAMEVIRRGTARLEQLLDDLIEFSTASREGLMLDQGEVDLPGLTAEIIHRCSKKAEKAGINLETDFPDDLPPVLADPEKLSWVLFQLIDNGIKFTPSGGKVTLHAARRGGLVSIAVSDTGIGIATDRREEIFEPFHQLDGSASRRYGGTGLGLAMVKLILEAHDTEIKVKSSNGKGSAFSFSLPAAA